MIFFLMCGLRARKGAVKAERLCLGSESSAYAPDPEHLSDSLAQAGRPAEDPTSLSQTASFVILLSRFMASLINALASRISSSVVFDFSCFCTILIR